MDGFIKTIKLKIKKFINIKSGLIIYMLYIKGLKINNQYKNYKMEQSNNKNLSFYECLNQYLS